MMRANIFRECRDLIKVERNHALGPLIFTSAGAKIGDTLLSGNYRVWGPVALTKGICLVRIAGLATYVFQALPP